MNGPVSDLGRRPKQKDEQRATLQDSFTRTKKATPDSSQSGVLENCARSCYDRDGNQTHFDRRQEEANASIIAVEKHLKLLLCKHPLT